MVQGFLKSLGFRLQRRRVRASISEWIRIILASDGQLSFQDELIQYKGRTVFGILMATTVS